MTSGVESGLRAWLTFGSSISGGAGAHHSGDHADDVDNKLMVFLKKTQGAADESRRRRLRVCTLSPSNRPNS